MSNGIIRANIIYALHLTALILFFPLLQCVAIIKQVFKIGVKKVDIKGEVALVTGAAQGLGRKLAIELAQKGCHIALLDVLEDEVKSTAEFIAETYKVKTKAYKVDISNYHELTAFHSKVTQDFGDITILIHNAGIIKISDHKPIDFEVIQKIVTVNFTAHVWLNQLFLPRMKFLNRGNIVAISSLSALFPLSIFQIYAPTKSAVRSYMQSLRADLKSYNYQIKLLTIMPTYMNTNKAAIDVIISSGLTTLYPVVQGAEAAKRIIEGMLQGIEEMTIPRVAIWLYKFMEMLPTWLRDIITSFSVPKLK